MPVDRNFVTGVSHTFPPDEIIVSKTDPKGIMTYVNDVFIGISGYTEKELIGYPHNIIRHPDMPRCVFRLMWDTIMSGQEIFAYVKNRCKSGDHYWVFAHITPNFDAGGKICGYHSNRRVPGQKALDAIIPLYRNLLDIEQSASTREEGLAESSQALASLLAEKGISYDRFVFSLQD